MARLRLQHDLNNYGPFTIFNGSSASSNEPPTALAFQLGSQTYPLLTDVAGTFMDVRGRLNDGATEGDCRALRTQLYLYGTPGTYNSGEALRAITNVNANIANAHGAHISLSFLATAGASECTGLGAAGRFTLHIPAPTTGSWAPTGTLTGLQVEIYSDGATSDPDGLTELSVLRLVNAGNATGMADVDTDAVLISVQGFTVGNEAANKVWINTITAATMTAACTEALKIKVGSNIRYIPIATAVE